MCSNQEQYQRQGTEQHEETVQPQAMMSKPVLNALKHVPTTLSSTIAKPPENKSGLCFAGRNRVIFNASGGERSYKQNDYEALGGKGEDGARNWLFGDVAMGHTRGEMGRWGMKSSRRMMRGLVYGVAAVLAMGTFAGVARADSLSIVYSVSQNQTVDVQNGAFTVVTFTGSVTNNTNAPIAFQLTGGPEPFEQYVGSFQNGIGFPGITLGAGQSTGQIDLAIVA